MNNFFENNLNSWHDLAKKELEGKDDLKNLKWMSQEGIEIKALYTKDDLEGLNHINTLPGFAPFVRGPKATMYYGKPWTIRQYAGFSTAKESNKFYRNALKSGQKGLSIAFDLATHRGYDSDHLRVIGDVGKAGVAIDSVEDMKLLFDKIPLDKMSVSMTMNGAVLPILASYIVAAEEQGVKRCQLSGTIQNDILKEFLVRNTYIYPPKSSMKIVSDIIDFTSKEMPKFNSISISGYHMQEAGANQVQELAFTIADGLEYVNTAINNGLPVDAFAPRLSFFFAIGMNFFMEVAKLRAARYIWAIKMKELFSPKNSKSLMLRTHCQTSGVSLTEKDAYNNIIRTTIEAMAAIMGGTQSLHTNSFDEAVALPSEMSSRIARNTQLILQNETDITKTIDPLAGSYYIESLTNSLIVHAGNIIDKIINMGGMTKAIEDGFPGRLIEESAIKKQAKVDSGQEVIVGVNKYHNENEEQFDILEIDNTQVKVEQIASLKKLKKNRNSEDCNEALNNITNVAKTQKGNLLEACINAVRKRATIGEISLALEKVFSRYEEKIGIIKDVYATNFDDKDKIEEIKDNIESFILKNGRRPKMLVAKLGQDGHDRGAKVIASSFSDLGFEVEITKLFLTPKELLQESNKGIVDVIGISSHAAAHMTLVTEFMQLLRSNEKKFIIVCGGVIPKKDIKKLKNIGVSEVFGPGTNILDASNKVLSLIKYGGKSNL
ncbi:MAG: methylmalonyl-CoA mutase [Rickettsiales bacterium]|nr:methylmalonyl-CoA mutase [Rickettsiales bacterium]